MWADLLTKERKIPEALEDVLIRNVMDIEDTTINKVKAHGQEVMMTNIRIRMNPGVSANCDPTVKIRLNKNKTDIEISTIGFLASKQVRETTP